ncbi:MAG TPA: hypothetical protein VK845_09580 [Gemmatimonadales bacterium]|nr:hypothetical protein [Gemmatimonadales bacterium]
MIRTTSRAVVFMVAIVPWAAPRLAAQRLVWRNEFTFYGDNTEFFTPFREGETLLGGQFKSFLRFKTSEHTEVLAGVFGDQRSGSDEFLDPVKPLLSFRYRTKHSVGVLGTLETVDRHGFLEPLQVTTLEITRPVEYGLQWVERRERLDAEAFINWQVLNTRASREIFDYGLVLRVRPLPFLALEYQGHGKHRGGQLFSAGVQVTNNFAGGPGLRLTAALPVVREGRLALFRLWSSGIFATDPLPGRPDKGHGTYLKASVTPPLGEFFTVLWWGRDFLSEEGDNNYNSVGVDPTFYRSKRRYTEIGFVRRMTIDEAVHFRVELRFHKIDDDTSKAISGTNWEYSYRIMVQAPFEISILRGN